MTDEDLVQAFERGDEPDGGFHHAEHVRVAWYYLQAHALPEALLRFTRALRAFAAAQGRPNLYHETITVAFMLVIAERAAEADAPATWDAFAAGNVDLLTWKPSVLDRYYRTETLWSDRARRHFVMPDRLALPAGCRERASRSARSETRMTGSNGQVTLRRARPADAAEITEIWYHGWCDGHLGHVSDQLVAVRTPQSFQTRAADRIGDTTVAVVDGTVAGFVMVVADEVEQVYVSAAHRGKGVADALMREAERLVRANGHTRAWLAVVAGNARARRFYERCGWSDDGAFEYSAYSEEGPISVPSHRYVKEI